MGCYCMPRQKKMITPDGQTTFRDGNVIYYRTLDLNQNFENIKKQLDGFIGQG